MNYVSFIKADKSCSFSHKYVSSLPEAKLLQRNFVMVAPDVHPEVGTSGGQTGSAHEVQTMNWRREDASGGTVGKKDNLSKCCRLVSKIFEFSGFCMWVIL